MGLESADFASWLMSMCVAEDSLAVLRRRRGAEEVLMLGVNVADSDGAAGVVDVADTCTKAQSTTKAKHTK